ncbi:hypothetical protein KAI87_00660 [Myxococcota bacterium]|nr:hypothetical protein [Myxococcota bacterium]
MTIINPAWEKLISSARNANSAANDDHFFLGTAANDDVQSVPPGEPCPGGLLTRLWWEEDA